ncbi:MAG TPA: serine protease, partial [Pyrinomonadaceae bacterium]|nr:serine protease [Pyrinomonadaceae bacterium]
IRKQYAQSLIEQGFLTNAEMVLQSIIQDPRTSTEEKLEAQGLTGRIFKQIYIKNNDPRSAQNRANLKRALTEYFDAYRADPQNNFWHGINVVALTERARRDKLPSTELPDAKKLAQAILKNLEPRICAATPMAWELATAMEAYVALGRDQAAVATASAYIFSEGADAFEVESTLRQLTEVWQLNDQKPPGSYLLPILRAASLSKQGGIIEEKSKDISHKVAVAEDTMSAMTTPRFEKVFTPDAMVTLAWYKKGLEQCTSIARIENRDGEAKGTGWLVNARDFFPNRRGKLLLTNEHVISKNDQHPSAMLSKEAKANFRVVNQIYELGEIVATSPNTKLDYTFVRLKGEPEAAPLAIDTRPVKMPNTDTPPRLYIIGHPAGRDITFSLQDNYLLECDKRLLRYRTPTEPGSSGSPVFESRDWKVVALHHAGSQDYPRLDGKGKRYQANEGIALVAIKAQTQREKP